MVGWSWSISRGWSICRGWSISWSWGIGRSCNNWSSMVSWSWGMVTFLVLDEGLVWAWGTLILDISMILLILIHKVVHNLNSAVWQLNSVLTYKTLIMLLLDEKR